MYSELHLNFPFFFFYQYIFYFYFFSFPLEGHYKSGRRLQRDKEMSGIVVHDNDISMTKESIQTKKTVNIYLHVHTNFKKSAI